MVFLAEKDQIIRDHLNKSLGNKYTSQDIQNKLLKFMARHVLHEKIEEIIENVFFYNELISMM